MDCSICDMFGQNNTDGKPLCFDCSDFSSSVFAKQILDAVNTGDFEADEDLLQDFNRYINRKFVPTRERQANTTMDKVAVWLVSKLGTMTFFWLCFAMVTIPLIWDKTMPVIQYVSSGYLQLLFLPLIMIAGNLQQRRAELREESAYRMSIKQDIEIEWLNYKLDKIQSKL